MSNHWRITHAKRLRDAGDFAIELERGDDFAEALVTVHERARHDPALEVTGCTSISALAWLEELEHERMVIDACLEGVPPYGRALRLLRGEAVSP